MRILKIVGILVLILVIAAAGAVTYVTTALPDVGEAPDLTIERTPERIARGEYLANNLMGCLDCHAQRDFTKFTAPVIKGTEGSGGEHWGHEMGFPGELYAPNISPTAIGDWTDGEVYRAITVGVNKDGEALFPIMPYLHYGQMPDEDIYSVIAYLRTLPAQEKEFPARELDFPLNLLVNTMPVKNDLKMSIPDKSDKVKYGEYLVNAAACSDCHTPQVKGKYVMERYMGGGMEFVLPNGTVSIAANITPHKTSGIGYWTEQAFINRFATYRDSVFIPQTVNDGQFNTMMPWTYFSRLSDEELGAIYAYLQTLTPLEGKVQTFKVATTK